MTLTRDQIKQQIDACNQQIAVHESKKLTLQNHIETLTEENDPDLVIEEALRGQIDRLNEKIGVESKVIDHFWGLIAEIDNPEGVSLY